MTQKDNKQIQIESRTIGLNSPPFIIAEMSGNHNGSLDRALEIVQAAAETGVDALKLQTYTPDTMTIDFAKKEFFIDDPQSLWYGKSLYELYEEAQTPWEWHKPILDKCKQLGLACFSTPFDEKAVDFLESLDVPAYKVASFENNYLPLIKKIARTKKPMLISSGMASVAELDDAVQTARHGGCKDLVLLKCTSSYPAPPDYSNILTLPHMSDLFQCNVGLSDHTSGIGVAIASVALKATVIEKHFTLDRSEGGLDSAFSLEPWEMKTLVAETKKVWKALGTVHYGPTKAEDASLKFRRSIYVVKDLNAGDTLTKDNIRIIRPGYGIEPKHYHATLGLKVNKKINRGTALQWKHFK